MRTKQIFVCGLVIAMFTAAFTVHAKGSTENGTKGLEFELINGNGNTAYRVRSGAVTGGKVRIPEYYNGKPVTEIGSADDDTGAFERTGITAVHIPSTITTIGRFAFYECSRLVTVTFAKDSQLETIGNSAFSRCENLARITIPANVTSIGSYAFSRCYNLATVTFAKGSRLETISNDAFADCGKLTGIEIPATVTSIGNSAFWECYNITAIKIPSGVKEIGSQTFQGCSLTEIEIPAGVEKIDGWAFYTFSVSSLTSILTSITVDEGNIYYASQDGILYDKLKTEIILVPRGISGAVTLPPSLMAIGDGAFSYCYGLTEITIPANIISVGNNAFSYCESLAEITIPANVTSIGNYAFYSCRKLAEINIPANVTSIGSEAFAWCNNLATVTFAEGSLLETIGNNAFPQLRKLVSIEIPASVTSVGNEAFSAWSYTQTIYIRGHANRTAADTAWGSNWRSNCFATIKYWNGNEYR